jgi:hypothetical protein
MKEFAKKFKDAIFEDDVYLRPVKIIENEDDLIIDFTVFLYGTNQKVQQWRVSCRNLIDYRLLLDYIEDIDIFNDHVLLWEYHHNHCELYFREMPKKSRNNLIVDLFKKHKEITEGWVEFEIFLNEWSKWMYDSEQGLLASGPDLLIQEYNTVLQKHGVKTSIIPSKKQTEECSVMIFGQSYVIASQFRFELVE